METYLKGTASCRDYGGVMNKIQERLKELRKVMKVTQRNVADELGITQVTYCHWENGQTQPDIENIIALCKYFSVSADYLLGISDF